MGLFGGGNSTTKNDNRTENTNTQLGNYGNGWQVVNGGDGTVNVTTMDSDVAITAIKEAGLFSETVAMMNENMHRVNTQFADNAIASAQASARASAQASARTAQTSIQGAYQFADNAIADNRLFMDSALSSNNGVVQDTIDFVGNVVSDSAIQSKKLADSVLNMAESVKTGTTASSKNTMKVVIFVAVGALALALVKK